ncbi:MFS transporter [Streptomyces albireticuli]|uniref:MFS transporter n=1 Tax=Streptomyces albireticuli TaxID=1940 RepID=UPI0036A341BA
MGNPYGKILSVAGAPGFVAAGFVARLAHLMTVLGTVFLVSSVTGSYGLAGLVSAAYALTYSVASPLLSRRVDRQRQSRVLAVTTLANAVSRAGFLVAVRLEGPGWSLVLLSALSGGTMPAIGSLVRARWSHLLHGSPLLHAALAFESVVDEVILVAGPIAVAVLVTGVDPVAGLVLALVCTVVGQTALALQRGTEPPVADAGRHGRGTALTTPGLPWLMVTFIAVGTAGSVIDLGVVAFTEEHGAKAASGWVLGLLALGSAVAGLWYGARPWSSPPERRLAATLPLFTGGTLLFAVAPGVAFLFPAAVLLGLTMAPALIAGFSAVERHVPRHRLTEGMALVTTSMGIGISLGSATAGKAVDLWGPRAALGWAGCWAAAAALAGLVTARRLRRATAAAGEREHARTG